MDENKKKLSEIKDSLSELVDDSYMNNMIGMYKLGSKVRQTIKEEFEKEE